MSDEPSSSSAAASSANLHDADAGESTSVKPAEDEVAARRKRNSQIVSMKRSEFLIDLLTSFDVLVYAELSTIYYMDCSFLRFLFRSVVQFFFLTPKPASFPEPLRERPVIGGILFSNFICIFLHLWLNAPAAGEPTRGYLHGGLVMDFIGQKGPTSKTHLLLLDLSVLMLQFVQLSADTTRRTLKNSSPTNSATQPLPSQAATSPEAPRQDLDAEERGVHRSQEGDDIELHDLNPAGSTRIAESSADESMMENTEASDEHHALLSATTMTRDDSHIFDAFNSGQIVIADLNIVRTFLEQYRRWRAPPPELTSDQERQQSNIGRAEFAGRLLSMRFGNEALRRGL